MKPIVFFSHASADRALLAELRTSFEERTGGALELFLSSDGQSIPLGRNWVHRVEEALSHAGLMIVFLTPRSLQSSWVHFEAGFAYSKGVRVVPVALPGVDMGQVPAPLGLLQGFNVRSADGLNNLIALVNSAFDHAHALSYTDEHYRELMAAGFGYADSSTVLFTEVVEDLFFKTENGKLGGVRK